MLFICAVSGSSVRGHSAAGKWTVVVTTVCKKSCYNVDSKCIDL